ncbi:MAG: hypothetical protein ACK58T_16205, partial [Phycisphaerae bacterium]
GLQQGREAGIQEGLQVGRDVGIREGHEAGLSTGIMIGRIQLLQQLLVIPVTQVEEFIGWDEDRLSSLQADLQSRLNR